MVHFCVIARSRSDEVMPVREEKGRIARSLATTGRMSVEAGNLEPNMPLSR